MIFKDKMKRTVTSMGVSVTFVGYLSAHYVTDVGMLCDVYGKKV